MFHDPVLDTFVAYVSSALFERLKQSAFPWVSAHTPALNHAVMALWSLISSAGVTFVWTSANGGGFTVSGLNGLYYAARQYFLQRVVYRYVVKGS